ncbi:MAG: ATP-binding cassette domain-containing protein, partial [Planctomycetota bacterium]
MNEEPILEFDRVSFAYAGDDVLADASFAVARGDFVSIIGPNGGGKSTLLRLALGLLSPRRGRIRVLGVPPARARPRIGYLPQYLAFDAQFPITV